MDGEWGLYTYTGGRGIGKEVKTSDRVGSEIRPEMGTETRKYNPILYGNEKAKPIPWLIYISVDTLGKGNVVS